MDLRNATEVNYSKLAIAPNGTPQIRNPHLKRQQILLECAKVKRALWRFESGLLVKEDGEELLGIWRQIFTRGIPMMNLPLICVVQSSGTPVKTHTYGCLTDVEIPLEVLPCNLNKSLVAVGVKTKV